MWPAGESSTTGAALARLRFDKVLNLCDFQAFSKKDDIFVI
jgi:hypothetical protein